MDSLEFRKFITEYGYTYQEYEKLNEEDQEKLKNEFEIKQKNLKTQEKQESIKSVGEGIQGCGCILMLIPVAIVFLVIVWAIITG